ncbi:STAS domain-containing protein [Streptomyces sp. NPDC101181]|uniref:STAS domain-containing protein n=1 Tax=Streptomyces sp. NPDC101181 TaxID=3366125 RepID=UPI0038122211
MSRSPARVHVRAERDAFVVVVSGDFDTDERDLLDAAWDEADERALPTTAVELSGVTFGDSSFLDALLRARQRHRAARRRLVLIGPLHPRVLLLLTVTKVLEHFEVAESLTGGLEGGPHSGTGR